MMTESEFHMKVKEHGIMYFAYVDWTITDNPELEKAVRRYIEASKELHSFGIRYVIKMER